MNIQAIWENGVFRPLQSINIKHATLTIVVPDEEIETGSNQYNLSPEVIQRARAMRAKFDAIRNAPVPPDDELPDLTEKQLNRITAFALREDR